MGDASISGVIVADSPRQARDMLRGRGLTVQAISAQSQSATRRRHPWRHRGLRAQLPALTRELSTLLGAGVQLTEALDALSRQHAGALRSIILLLRERIAAGGSLAEAMSEHPQLFDALSINLVETGENAGTLDVTLSRLADFQDRSAQLKGRLTTAILYPCIVLCMATGVSIFLMTYVVPQLLTGLLEAGRPIPLPTRVVKGLSDFLLGYWWLLLLLAAAAIGGFIAALRTQWGLRAFHRSSLRAPLLGDMLRKQAIMRIAIVVSTLLKSGVVFERAIQIAQRTSRNLVIREALNRCEVAVRAGADISRALEKTGVFPPSVIQIFSVGEQSGRLEEMLDRLASDYDQQLATSTQRLTTILEPVLIVIMVGIVGLIAFATILPILEATSVF